VLQLITARRNAASACVFSGTLHFRATELLSTPRQAGGKVAVLEKETFPRDKYCGAPEPQFSFLKNSSLENAVPDRR
jgi:hypothetical protein